MRSIFYYLKLLLYSPSTHKSVVLLIHSTAYFPLLLVPLLIESRDILACINMVINLQIDINLEFEIRCNAISEISFKMVEQIFNDILFIGTWDANSSVNNATILSKLGAEALKNNMNHPILYWPNISVNSGLFDLYIRSGAESLQYNILYSIKEWSFLYLFINQTYFIICNKIIIVGTFHVFYTSLIKSMVNTPPSGAIKGGTSKLDMTKPSTSGTFDNNTKIKKSNKGGYNPEPISKVKQRRKAEAVDVDVRFLSVRSDPGNQLCILLYDILDTTCNHLKILFITEHPTLQYYINGVLTTCIIHPGLNADQFEQLRIVHNITDTFVETAQGM